MCWSLGASVAMVGLGAAGTAVAIRRGAPPAVPVAFAYFTAMEGLQAVGYLHVGQCGVPANQMVTLLSYLHIAFQPLVINAFAMAMLGGLAARPRLLVQGACWLSALVMLLQLYPFDWAGRCTAGATLCGEQLCLRHGEWHIAWDIPWNGLLPSFGILPGYHAAFPSYVLSVLVLPALYGAWRFALFHLLAGPVLAGLLTRDPNEMPAIWCLFSIALLAVGMNAWLWRTLGGVAPLRRASAA
jgi:hypothetical protein